MLKWGSAIWSHRSTDFRKTFMSPLNLRTTGLDGDDDDDDDDGGSGGEEIKRIALSIQVMKEKKNYI